MLTAGFLAVTLFKGAFFDAGFFGAAIFVATPLAAGCLTAEFFVAENFTVGFREADFLIAPAFGFMFFDTAFLAVIFLAASVLALAGFPMEVLAVAAFRACNRDGVVFRIAALVASCVVLAAPDRVVFGFVVRAGGAFARETLTSPRMARPGGRTFAAAAFSGGRRIGLLRGVEAMGPTLVTVATW